MKPSFKTTTLIAAIGMTITTGYIVVEQFLDVFLGIDLYVHPIRMHGFWRLHDCIWWASIAIFFWGLFRYPNQLPKRNKQSKTIGIVALVSIVLLFIIHIWIMSSDDPQWLRVLHSLLRCIAYVGGTVALWWCYANSSEKSTSVAIRYVALSTIIISSIALIINICSDLVWWFGVSQLNMYASYYTMSPFINATYILAAICILIGLYMPSSNEVVLTKTHQRVKHLYASAWILISVFAVVVLLVSFAVLSLLPEWLEMITFIAFIIIPLVAGIFMLITCRIISQLLKSIESNEQNPQ